MMVMLKASSMDNRVTDCYQELKCLRDLQYESDFNDKFQESEFFRRKAEHIQNLINEGVDFIPNF